jgi:hypothetical protein
MDSFMLAAEVHYPLTVNDQKQTLDAKDGSALGVGSGGGAACASSRRMLKAVPLNPDMNGDGPA